MSIAKNGVASYIWSQNGSDIYYNSGKVGIGVASPDEKVDVDGNIKILGNLTDGANPSSPVDIKDAITKKHTKNTDIALRTDKVTVLSGGKVGIENTNPTRLLHLGGGDGMGTTNVHFRLDAGTDSDDQIEFYSGGGEVAKIYVDASNFMEMMINTSLGNGINFAIAGTSIFKVKADRVLIHAINELTANQGVTIETVLIKDGNVDGRDVSVDGTKLDGIAENADVSSANQSATTASIAGHNVNELDDISSSGANIEDAVSKRHNHTGFTSLGSGAPPIKMKKLTGTLDLANMTIVPVSVTASKILSATAIVSAGGMYLSPDSATAIVSAGGMYLSPDWTHVAGWSYQFNFDDTNFNFQSVDVNLQGTPYKILIFFEE